MPRIKEGRNATNARMKTRMKTRIEEWRNATNARIKDEWELKSFATNARIKDEWESYY